MLKKICFLFVLFPICALAQKVPFSVEEPNQQAKSIFADNTGMNYQVACESLPQKIEVELHLIKPQLFQGQQAQQMVQVAQQSSAGVGGIVLGLTQPDFAISGKYKKVSLPNKETSIQSQCYKYSYHVDIMVKKMNIYIPSGLNNDSCAYQELLEHEMKHVAIYERNLKVLKILMERNMNNDQDLQKVIYSPNDNPLQDIITYNKALVSAFYTASEAENDQWDAQEQKKDDWNCSQRIAKVN